MVLDKGGMSFVLFAQQSKAPALVWTLKFLQYVWPYILFIFLFYIITIGVQIKDTVAVEVTLVFIGNAGYLFYKMVTLFKSFFLKVRSLYENVS